ncbi:MAG: chemotaxis protein [Epulopiscium sp. Nuni2H_MBin003]|nr:MAG: chemotaxis protein [Epulopiscium sp. Nuni2H_MBin003]
MKSIRDYKYIIVIGVSTGGPKTLKQLFSNLSKDLPATYVVVQHMPAGYIDNMSKRLNECSELSIKKAAHGDILRRGEVYISPGGMQCTVIDEYLPKIKIIDGQLYKGYRPSVNLLFSSVAKLNCNTLGIILTGMGQDGLEGVRDLKLTHKTKIIVQDKNSSIVYGMPSAIVEAGLSDYVLNIYEMSKLIKKLVR